MTDLNNPDAAAEERVRQFMSEFETHVQAVAPRFDDDDNPLAGFPLWRELMAQTERNHFVEGTRVGLGQSFQDPAEYGPSAEELMGSEIEGDTAYVMTRLLSAPLESFHEYRLRRDGADWKIEAINTHYDDPKAAFVSQEKVDKRTRKGSLDAPLSPMPSNEVAMDETRNFIERDVQVEGESDRAQVSEIGTFVTTSGVLAVLDFGYGNDDAYPLARSVAPGSYPVDRIVAFGRNAAVRVRFSSQTPTAWHPASLPKDRGHVIGVDAGCACIVDYPAYATMTRRAKDVAYDEFLAGPRPQMLEFATGDSVGIAVEAGYGDGNYPVYWGVDAQGEVAQIVIDFLVLADQDDDGKLTLR